MSNESKRKGKSILKQQKMGGGGIGSGVETEEWRIDG